ncbi:hypothetical protein Pcaca03_21520 [Pectobacterium carotovorum subsp. carotovorum]|uniref:Uncharacterized protein n=1 Tax=Pectobacterium carotovorum subsp. carotovorum TaxID=555 RepID=A0AAI9PER3_PECCC|nr:hypothetical protein SOASR016_19880 [Pectobacterium carotovorum subsp. carotovorum]GLV69708.1 hypothetical protein Pcaca03_21520 [Pectobacterium carotovorum subsp. carotovorum]
MTNVLKYPVTAEDSAIDVHAYYLAFSLSPERYRYDDNGCDGDYFQSNSVVLITQKRHLPHRGDNL